MKQAAKHKANITTRPRNQVASNFKEDEKKKKNNQNVYRGNVVKRLFNIS